MRFVCLAASFLKDAQPGTFVVRDSQSYNGAFGLAVKVAAPPDSVLQQVNGDLSKSSNTNIDYSRTFSVSGDLVYF